MVNLKRNHLDNCFALLYSQCQAQPPDSSGQIGYIKGYKKCSPFSFYSPGPETETAFPTLVNGAESVRVYGHLKNNPRALQV